MQISQVRIPFRSPAIFLALKVFRSHPVSFTTEMYEKLFPEPMGPNEWRKNILPRGHVGTYFAFWTALGVLSMGSSDESLPDKLPYSLGRDLKRLRYRCRNKSSATSGHNNDYFFAHFTMKKKMQSSFKILKLLCLWHSKISAIETFWSPFCGLQTRCLAQLPRVSQS